MDENNSKNSDEIEYLKKLFGPIGFKLVMCTSLSQYEIEDFLPTKSYNHTELYIFSQWISLNFAALNEIESDWWEEYSSKHDRLYIIENPDLSTEIMAKVSQLRAKRFTEYEEFHKVIESYLGGKPPGALAIKFSRIVLTNLLGSDATKHLLTTGPMLPMKVIEILLTLNRTFDNN